MTKQLLLVTSCAFLLSAATAASGQTPNAAAIYKERCASCHDAGPGAEATRAPARDVLRSRTAPQIFATLEPGGSMAANAIGLSTAEKHAVAAFLAGAGATTGSDPAVGLCAAGAALPDPASLPAWNGWGNDASNSRFQNAKAAGLTAADVPKLTLKWAFGFPGASVGIGSTDGGRGPRVRRQRQRHGVFARCENGMHALDVQGRWRRPHGDQRRARSRSTARRARSRCSATFARTPTPSTRRSGTTIWKTKVDDHAMARITGAPSYHNGRLYVPVVVDRGSRGRAPQL